MSTGDLDTLEPLARQAFDASQALPAGAPDPTLLERLANEFFKSPTAPASVRRGIPTEPRSGATTNASSFYPHDATGMTLPSAASVPTVPSPVQVTGATIAIPAEAPTVPGIPGGFSLATFSGVPTFGFLDDARSIVASPPAVPIHAAPIPPDAVKIPTDTGLSFVPMSVPGFSTPTIPVSHPDLSAPPIPGTVARAPDFGKPNDFGFLADLNSLVPIDVIPRIEPAGLNPGVPKDVQLSSVPFDVAAIRRDFPILQERVNGRQLIWLDNAATTQKPQSVIDRISYFYQHENSNIHRAAHTMAARATDAYEAAREKVRRFLNAGSVKEIIFVRGATEGVNLVARTWGRKNIQKDDEILITHLEHHANIVPWQMLCSETGARLKVAPVDDGGQVILEVFEKLITPRTKLVAFTHVSNALGTVTPVEEMVDIAHRHGARVLLDGAQSVSHMRVDMQAYDCDFFVFSGHKVFAPTGIGVVYGKADLLDSMPPYQGGGNMIQDVTFEKTSYMPPPFRFEAGTGNIADAVGLGAAIDYVERVGMHNIARYEHDLLVYATGLLERVPGLHLIGTARDKASVLSFVLDGFKTEEVGAAFSAEGIAVRSGHHCAQPILRRFGLESTVRPSLAFYNTCDEIDALVSAIWNLKSGRGASVL